MENTPLPSFLALETSDAYTSVALLRHGETLFVRESTEHNDHAEVLDVMIQEVLAEAGLGFPDLAAIGISQGPGSYTGLRIGYATVKGLCFATGLPMIAVPTLAALAGKMELLVGTPPEGQKCCFVPMIDARRMEVYTQTFLPQLQATTAAYPCILEERLPERPDGLHAYYAGSGAEKAQRVLALEDWTYVECPTVRAADLLPVLQARYLGEVFEDIAYSEPLYVKEFEATPSTRTPFHAPTKGAGAE